MKTREFGNVIGRISEGRLSRRCFVTRSIGIGVSLSAASALLAACGEDDPEDVDGVENGDDEDVSEDSEAAAVETPAEDGEAVEDAETPDEDGDATEEEETPEPEADVEAGILAAPEEDPQSGGTLRTAFDVAMTNYDIHQGGAPHVLTHMYNRLLRPNPLDGLETLIPDLAEQWEVSDDGLTYTFSLREGVEFHDGEPFSANDVVATYSRIIDPPEGITGSLTDWFHQVESVEAVDSTTAQFNLADPQADLLLVMATPSSVIYSQAALEENDQDLRTVIAPGTGAFMYEDHSDDERWLFVRNDNYWNPLLPYIDEIDLISVPGFSNRGTAVLTNEAHMSWNVAYETFEEGEGRDDEIGTRRAPSNGQYAIMINCEREPFNDQRVRRAMHLVVSRQNLIEAFRTQEVIALRRAWIPHASPFATPMEEVEQLPGYRPEKEEDIAEAQALLEEAGYPDGFDGVELLVASVAAHAEIMAPAFQNELASTLNIQTEIRATEEATRLEEEQAGNFDLVLITRGSPTPDFSPFGNLYFKSDGAQNFGNYSNTEFDELLAESDIETDEDRRAEMLDEIQDVLDQDPPWVSIGWTFHLLMWRNELKGLAFDQRAQAVWGQMDTAWLDQ